MPDSVEHTSVQYRKKAIPLSWSRRVLVREQRKMFEAFTRHFAPRPGLRVLDLGTNASLERPELYTFQQLYPYRGSTVACGLEPGDEFKRCFPDVEYVRARRGEALPFRDGEFDVVHCAAVIEHVGSRAAQRAFLREIARIGKAAFVTTPNRWFPIELHTVLPLVHYLPAQVHRPILRRLGFDFFAQEVNLNLLDRSALRSLVPVGRSVDIHEHRFFGLCSNLMLVMR
jgi:hypothetical protein